MQATVRSAAGTLIGEAVALAGLGGNLAPAIDLPAFRLHVRCMSTACDLPAPGPEQGVGCRTFHRGLRRHISLPPGDARVPAMIHDRCGDSTPAGRADTPRPEGSARSRPVASCIRRDPRTRASRPRFPAHTGTAGNPSSSPRARGEPTLTLACRASPTLVSPSWRRQAERGRRTRSRSCAFACRPAVSDTAM
jgi:hypothetical protein